MVLWKRTLETGNVTHTLFFNMLSSVQGDVSKGNVETPYAARQQAHATLLVCFFSWVKVGPGK